MYLSALSITGEWNRTFSAIDCDSLKSICMKASSAQQLKSFALTRSAMWNRSLSDLPSLQSLYLEEKALFYSTGVELKSTLRFHRSILDLDQLVKVKFERENLTRCGSFMIDHLCLLQRFECGKGCLTSCHSLKFLHCPKLEIISLGDDSCVEVNELILHDLPSLKWFSAGRQALQHVEHVEVTAVKFLCPKCVKLKVVDFPSLSELHGDENHPILQVFHLFSLCNKHDSLKNIIPRLWHPFLPHI